MNKKSTLVIKRLLPVMPLVFGLVAVAAVARSQSSSKPAVAHDVQAGSQAAAATPDIDVNGRKVHPGPDGKADVGLPGGGNAHVDVSGGAATVSEDDPAGGATGNSANSQNMSVSVHSESNGGTSNSQSQVFGNTTTTSSNGSSHSSTSTHVFSTGPAQVEVNAP